NRGIATTSRGNYAAGQAKVVKSYNCLGEGHMAKQCTQLKRPRSSAWFEEKLMLAEAQEAGQILDEEQLAFIADHGIAEEMPYSKQTHIVDFLDNEITSDINIISYSQYLHESQNAGIQDTSSSTPNDLLILSLVEQMADHVANLDKENQTNKMVNESLTAELERYKENVAFFEQRLNVDLNKRGKLIDSQMDDLIRNRNAKFAAFQTECKEKESKYMDKEIVLENQNKELENTLCKLYRSMQAMHMLTKPQRIKPRLYDGSAIAKEHDVISVIDDEETLILEEDKQAFWLKHSNYNPDISVKSHTPIRIEAPSELPKVSLVNESLKNLKYQLASFDKVVKKRTISDAITAGA
ncbi:hypothetical protein Tco_1279798, partial [Tanacetum coccineum]